jgi:hypothetical protein
MLVGWGTFSSELIIKFAFDILQISSGCIQVGSGFISLTGTPPPGYGPNCCPSKFQVSKRESHKFWFSVRHGRFAFLLTVASWSERRFLMKYFSVCKRINRCLELRHPRCVCNNEVEYNGGQNSTSLLAGYSFGVNKPHVSAYSEAIIRFTNVSYRRLITVCGYLVRC